MRALDYPPPYPNCWYRIGNSADLKVGDVKVGDRAFDLIKFQVFISLVYPQSVECLGQHLVLFRGESGAVSVLDAYCPHLGAHLAVGGEVVGDTISCPFHK